jgi:hypothetical protein
MAQGANQAASNNALQIGMSDEENRIRQLGALPGMENQALEPQFKKLGLQTEARQYDIGNQVAERQLHNRFNMDRFGNLAKLYGAEKTAQATENSGK